MRTVLFGLDGATFTVLDPLMSEGLMPNLAAFCAEGVQSELRSTPLPITPQAWTSMATGRSMGNHGINDFVRIEIRNNSIYAKYNTFRDIHCETIWKYVSRSGSRATVLNYVGMAPPEEIDGHVIPGFVPARHLRRSSYPADLVARLESRAGADVSLLGLDLEFEKQVLSQMPADQWLPWIEHHIAREQAWQKVLEDLMIHEPSDLTAIVFDGVDKIQHLAYRLLDPAWMPSAPTPWERSVMDRCRAYFQQVDEFLGRVREIIGPDGRIFIASDHGFTASTEIVYINRFLHDAGLLEWKQEVEEDSNETIFVDRLRHHLDRIDLKRTKAFAVTPSCNGIFLNVSPGEYDAFRERLIEDLYRIKGADGGQVVIDVKPREQWFRGPYMHHAPDLTLTLRDHGLISVLNGPAAVVARTQPWGTHHPDGVLLASGPGLRRGVRVDRRDILDVAPLLAHSLGLEIPGEYEGEFPTTFYDAAYLPEDPPRVRCGQREVDTNGSSGQPEIAAEGPHAAAHSDEATEDDEIVFQRLRSLGYIE